MRRCTLVAAVWMVGASSGWAGAADPAEVTPTAAPPEAALFVCDTQMVTTREDAVPAESRMPIRSSLDLLLSWKGNRGIPVRLRVTGYPVTRAWTSFGEPVETQADGVSAVVRPDPRWPSGLDVRGPEGFGPTPAGLHVERRVDPLTDGRVRFAVAVRSPGMARLDVSGIPKGATEDTPRGPEEAKADMGYECTRERSVTLVYPRAGALVPVPRVVVSLELAAETVAGSAAASARHQLKFGDVAVVLEGDAPFHLSATRRRSFQVYLEAPVGRFMLPPRRSLLLADMEEDTANWGLDRDAAEFREGEASGRWAAGTTPRIASTLVPADWEAYPELSLWVHTAAALPDPLGVFVRADDPATPEEDGYRAEATLPAPGWQEILLPRDRFAAVGKPRGWGRVEALAFAAPPGLPPDAILRLDEIRIRRAPDAAGQPK